MALRTCTVGNWSRWKGVSTQPVIVPSNKILFLLQHQTLPNNKLMIAKNHRSSLATPDSVKMESGMLKLEESIHCEQSLCAHENCNCQVCYGGHTRVKLAPYKSNYCQNDKAVNNWMRKVLAGLTLQGMPTLKMYIPDFSFIDGELAEIFYTDYTENRIRKVQGTVPMKMLFGKLLRMRQKYKSMLEEGFRRSILDKIDPDFVHEQYMEQMLPSHFHNGEESTRLMANRSCFQKYVVHQNPKYILDSIQEHKINENQAFCSVHFLDSTMQLFTQAEFDNFTVMKLPLDIHYIQSYIKERQETKAIFTTEYNFAQSLHHPDLYERAELQVLVLIGGVGKYSGKFQEIQVLEDSAHQLMLASPELYAYYTSYRIVHYLAMVSRFYIKHLKMNWLLNDNGFVYLQDIFECETTEVSLRILKFRLPPREQNLEFYKDSTAFTAIYKQLQRDKEKKQQKLRYQLGANKTNPETTLSVNLATIDPIKPVSRLGSKLNKTIDISERSTQHRTSLNYTTVGKVSLKRPKLLTKNLLDPPTDGRKSEARRMSFFEKNVRYRNLTALDKYQI